MKPRLQIGTNEEARAFTESNLTKLGLALSKEDSAAKTCFSSVRTPKTIISNASRISKSRNQ